MKTSILVLALAGILFHAVAGDVPKPEAGTVRIQQLRREVARLEARCAPAAGTTRSDVEQKFGPGSPGSFSKVPGQAATNSLNRVYEFCANGTLWIRYDQTWHVQQANYEDPYQTKGLPAGATIKPEEEVAQLEQRLEQMKRIATAYEKKFGGESGSP